MQSYAPGTRRYSANMWNTKKKYFILITTLSALQEYTGILNFKQNMFIFENKRSTHMIRTFCAPVGRSLMLIIMGDAVH